ncbi:MAG TPA: acyl carrier protein [Bryobacteraceae bacterium]|nr:acyl carrier protein [Bryobacteraceae bacterium]
MTRTQQIAELVRKCSKKPTPPDPEEPLFDNGYLDSFILTDLVLELENAFGIRIPDSELNPRRFENVEKIEALVENRATRSAG